MRVAVYLIVLFGVFITTLSKDIVDIYEELRPEQRENLFEGDIKLTPEQRAMIDDTSGQRKATSTNALRWPRVGSNTQVPYVISSSSAADTTTVIEAAIQHWENNTCIDLIPRTYQLDYIEFLDSHGCWSYLGKIGGKQELVIGSCAVGIAPVVHEIGHAIGFWHEHNRPDRDDYITVHFENIDSWDADQFQKARPQDVDTGNVPYDCGSIMHYGPMAYSKNQEKTITAKNPEDNAKLGNNKSLSAADAKLANIIFGCPTK